MKNITLVLVIAVTLIVGGGIGYSFGKNTKSGGAESKELRDSVTMMKEQASTIKKMGEMMQSSGTMMQAMGTKYSDDGAVMRGKDMQMLGEKYLKDTTMKSGNSDSMKNMMGN